jgi:hypothetical protein
MKYIVAPLLLLMVIKITMAQTTVTLSVNQNPELTFAGIPLDTTIISGDSIRLGSNLVVSGGSGNYQYSWSPAATLSDSTKAIPIATPTDTITYLLTVTDQFGCSFSLNYTVNVKEPLVDTHLNSLQNNLKVILFPNPNTGKFIYNITGAPTNEMKITIITLEGKQVMSKKIKNFQGYYSGEIVLPEVQGVFHFTVKTPSELISKRIIVR